MSYPSEQSITAHEGPPAMEHRWGARLPCHLNVTVTAHDRDAGIGRLRNVSMTGAFLETLIDLPLFARVMLAIIPDEAHAQFQTEMTALVARIARDGVGIEWCEPAAGSICTLLGCTTRCGAPHSSVREKSADGSSP